MSIDDIFSEITSKITDATDATHRVNKSVRRNTSWNRAALIIVSVLVMGMLVIVVQNSQTIRQINRTADRQVLLSEQARTMSESQEEQRVQSREILRTILEYTDPTSDFAKRQDAATLLFLDRLTKRVGDIVRASGECRYEAPERVSYQRCFTTRISQMPRILVPSAK